MGAEVECGGQLLACPYRHQTEVLQGVHEPPLLPWKPGLQMHDCSWVDPLALAALAGQLEQLSMLIAPTIDEKVPPGQVVHAEDALAPEVFEYVPPGQATHTDEETAALVTEYLPAGQFTHCCEPPAEYEPIEHTCAETVGELILDKPTLVTGSLPETSALRTLVAVSATGAAETCTVSCEDCALTDGKRYMQRRRASMIWRARNRPKYGQVNLKELLLLHESEII